MSSTTLTVRTDSELKEQAKELYRELGMDLSTAINIFLRQSVADNGIPFQIRRTDQQRWMDIYRNVDSEYADVFEALAKEES